jgi:hypothetical protein
MQLNSSRTIIRGNTELRTDVTRISCHHHSSASVKYTSTMKSRIDRQVHERNTAISHTDSDNGDL